MFKGMRIIAPLAIAGLFSMGCESIVPEKPTDFEALQDTSDAFLAYERSDCATVELLSDPDRIAGWSASELKYSMFLLNGYCSELDGDIDDAREIYDRVIEAAPSSFAANDARERSRILRINASDPDHAAWMRDARDRAIAAQTSDASREPIERMAADFPPIARAAGVEGYAVVEFGVTPQGKTSDPVVIESSPPLLFDGTSIRAIRQWKYKRRARAETNDIQVIRLVFVGDHVAPGPEQSDSAAEPAPESDANGDASDGDVGETGDAGETDNGDIEPSTDSAASPETSPAESAAP